MAIFRLQTGHNRHLFTKFGVSQSDLCPCQTGSMTTEHLLQAGPLHGNLRCQFWPVETTVAKKLFGSLGDLWRTASLRAGNRSVHLSVRQEEKEKRGGEREYLKHVHLPCDCSRLTLQDLSCCGPAEAHKVGEPKDGVDVFCQKLLSGWIWGSEMIPVTIQRCHCS